MAMVRYDVGGLPQLPLDAAAEFHANHLPAIRRDLDRTVGPDLFVVFRRASHEHRAWRLAAIQELAREFAPRRANAAAGDDEAAIAATLTYLAAAPGITGQYLQVDGHGAGIGAG